MIATLKRREFLTLLGGAAAWPLAARAQQALPAIGFLHEGLPAPLSLTTAFQQGLIEAGVSAGSSLRIENRWAEGQYDRLPALAADLIEHRVGIIVAVYLVAARAAKAASLSRPTSNLTGVAFMFTRLGEKNLATLHELVPKAVVIGALVNPNNPTNVSVTANGFGLLGLPNLLNSTGQDARREDVDPHLSAILQIFITQTNVSALGVVSFNSLFTTNLLTNGWTADLQTWWDPADQIFGLEPRWRGRFPHERRVS
jgi:hypothetical protein